MATLADVIGHPGCRLQSVNLGHNHLHRVALLADALKRSRITDLNLSKNRLREAHTVALISAVPQTPIQCLNLSGIPFCTDLAFHLRHSYRTHSRTFRLRELVLTNYDISLDPALEAFLGNLEQVPVQVLDLSKCNLGDTRGAMVAKFLPESHLTTLRLESNGLAGAFAIQMAQALPATPNLTSLSLKNNKFGLEGKRSLFQALRRCNLTHLNLSGHGLDKYDMYPLAEVLPQTKIEELYLAHNSIPDEGAALLARVVRQSHSLCRLDLRNNRICGLGANILAKAKRDSGSAVALQLQANCIDEETEHALSNIQGLDCRLQRTHSPRM
mgnify:CR=1 FL=1